MLPNARRLVLQRHLICACPPLAVTFIGSALESSVYVDDISAETEAETPFDSRTLTGVLSENEAY